MSDRRAELIGKTATREVTFRADSVNEEKRTVEIAFSSEAPAERWYGVEILSHDAGAVRMARLMDGAPLLNQHRPGEQIGVVDSARIDPDKTGRAVVRFSKGASGEEIFQDVRDEIRTKVSVGYIVHSIKLEESGDDGDTYRVTDWEPLELSIVSIPADNAVGVGRDLSPQPEAFTMPEDPKKAPVADTTKIEPTDPKPTDATRAQAMDPLPAADSPVDPVDVIDNPDAAAIRDVGRHFGQRDLAEQEIVLGTNLEDFRALIRKQRPDPVPSVPRIETRIPHSGKLHAFRTGLYGSRREAEEQAYRAGQWARAIIFGDTDAARWCRDYDVRISKRVLTGGTGGQSTVVPDELVLPIIELREEYGVARKICRVHPMASDTATVPRRISGVTAYFVGRESAPTAGDPGLDNVSLTARNLAAESRVSNDYEQDSAINLAEFVAVEQALAFATKEDGCLFDGDGTSTYGGIIGLRVLLNAANARAGAVNAASGHDTFAEIDVDDLESVVGALPEIVGINPNWVASKRGEALMFGRLRAAGSGNSKRDLAEGVPKAWDGDDIVLSPAMPKGTASTDYSDVVMALYGDFKMGVILGDRRGMTIMVDPYSLSSYQQTKIIGSERFDLNCHGVGDTSDAGPIVALVGE